MKLYKTNKSNIALNSLEKIANTLKIDIAYFESPVYISYLSPNHIKTEINNSFSSQTLNNDIVNVPFCEYIIASAGSSSYNEAEVSYIMTFNKGFLREYFGLIFFLRIHLSLEA